MEQSDNDIYRALYQKWIHQPTRRERQQGNKIVYDNQGWSVAVQQPPDWNKKRNSCLFHFWNGSNVTF